MASRSDILAGRAFVELTLKNGLTQGLIKARQQLQQFASAVRRTARALTTIGTAMTAPFLAAVYKVDEVRKKLSEITDTLGQALAPAIMPILDNTLKIVQGFAQWAKNNEKTVTTVLRIGLGMVGVGVAFKAAAAAATLFSLALSAAAAVSGVIAGSPLLAALLAVGGSLTILTASWMRYSDSGQEAFAKLNAFAVRSLGVIKEATAGIGDALMGGNLELAGQIAITGLRLVMLDGANAIAQSIGGVFGAIFGSIAKDIIAGDFSRAWDTSLQGLAAAWDGLTAGLVTAFRSAIDMVRSMWQQMVGTLTAGLAVFEAAASKLAPSLVPAFRAMRQGLAAGGAVGSAALGATSSAFSAFEQQRRNRAGQSFGSFASRLGGDNAALKEEIASLRQQLDAQRKTAALGVGFNFETLKGMTGQAAASAGGALALAGSQTGSGGSLQQRILRASEKNVAASEATKSELAEVKTELTNIKTLLATL